MGIRADESRSAIMESAMLAFSELGYRGTTLAEIGARVGVTRGTVLYHFTSKAGLLRAAVGPYLDLLANVLAEQPVAESLNGTQQRILLSELADLIFEYPTVVRLLATDVAARAQLGMGDDWAMPKKQLVRSLLGNQSTAEGELRVAAALGAMVWPVIDADPPFDKASAKAELIASALAVLDRPCLVNRVGPGLEGNARFGGDLIDEVA